MSITDAQTEDEMKINTKTLFTGIWIALAMTPHLGLAAEIPNVLRRCAEDSLDPVAALGRVEWLRKCIRENGGDFHGFQLKHIYGLLNDFNDDESVVPRSRPMYPTFLSGETSWIAPTDASAACTVPVGFTSGVVCVSSCYTPDQQILFKDGYQVLFNAFRENKQGVAVLSSQSTLERPILAVGEQVEYTTEAVDTKNDIVEISTNAGPALKVTLNHPLLDDSGRMREAREFNVGDSLVKADGKAAQIVELRHSIHYGKVYNLSPALSKDADGQYDLPAQILVAQGYLAGSNYFQNSGAKYMNRVLLRRQIPTSLIRN
jgi:hypothetical protein